jgi:leucyl-tRNA synthetase
MRGQMKPLGFSIDWSREFATCDPEYYGQQQALFLDMLEAGLVTRRAAVGELGPCGEDRARQRAGGGRPRLAVGREVERRELTQWFFKISDMAGELLDALERLDDWPPR